MADAAFKPTRYGANVTESALRWHVSTHRITSSSYSDIVFPTSPTRLLWVMTPSMQRAGLNHSAPSGWEAIISSFCRPTNRSANRLAVAAGDDADDERLYRTVSAMMIYLDETFLSSLALRSGRMNSGFVGHMCRPEGWPGQCDGTIRF
mmetsp:Transcript_4469/g.10303  ORF Transcript_4469/g.10303 Transcript_4469/m.10303 type:complete len:149 (-) Transcript_4469:224-670(-)